MNTQFLQDCILSMSGAGVAVVYFAILFLVVIILPSFRVIGPTQVGLVMKRFSFKKLEEDNPIAFNGEAGYQADLLMPGWRWKFWVLYSVRKFPWVQIPAGQIGVVLAQVGSPLPIGAKSAVFKKEFANFSDVRSFIENGGQKGVQRPVLSPGTLVPMHPVAFMVITKFQTYGLAISPDLEALARRTGNLTAASFGLAAEQLEVVRIEPQSRGDKGLIDMVGIVTTYEGQPLPGGSIAGRLGGFADIEELEKKNADNSTLIEVVLGSKNELHNNYQDFQLFLDNGGKIGLQHDPLLYGAYNLNPFLVSVELVPMLVIEQGEVAVIKSYVGLVSEDTSGEEFKFGMLVKPGHRGIWEEPIRTGKYPINPHCYRAEIVPTCILTLNWAESVSEAHKLDQHLSSIIAKSREGFIFTIDLQVQIHVADTQAPKVISIVGTMSNLVSEVLQAAVGNHFRDKIQSMPAIRFIETRQQVQEEAFLHIESKLRDYKIETKGVYIQDVVLPEKLVGVLTDREIANQEKQTYKMQQEAQEQRILTEKSKGTADMQADLAKSQVGIDIKTNNANARQAEGRGEAAYIEQTGKAAGAQVEAIGMARAKAYEAQVKALGQTQTALVNVATVLSEGKAKFMPDVLVAGGGGSVEGLAASLINHFQKSDTAKPTVVPVTPVKPDVKRM
jgi:regulator of protease activity HflC (stomatin/prohibitin superfamily)